MGFDAAQVGLNEDLRDRFGVRLRNAVGHEEARHEGTEPVGGDVGDVLAGRPAALRAHPARFPSVAQRTLIRLKRLPGDS